MKNDRELIERREVTLLSIDEAFDRVKNEVRRATKKHGFLSFASPHEVLGVIGEEINECKAEAKDNNRDKFSVELEQVACVAVFGIASYIEQRKHELSEMKFKPSEGGGE